MQVTVGAIDTATCCAAHACKAAGRAATLEPPLSTALSHSKPAPCALTPEHV